MSELRLSSNSTSMTTTGSTKARPLSDGRVVVDFLDSKGARVASNVMSALEWRALTTSFYGPKYGEKY